LLYRKLHLTRVRASIDPGIQARAGAPMNFTKADTQAAFVKRAKEFGLRTFFPAPVYLEDWMQPNDVTSYVNWAMALLERWRSLGVTPPFYSVLNEPQVARNFPAQWLHDVVVQLGQRLRAAGFRTKLVIPDDENPVDAYTRAVAVLQDPGARQYVGAVAFHIYRIGSPADYPRLRALASRYRLPLWMTEYESPSYDSYRTAFDWAVKMHQLLTIGSVNAVDYLWGFFGDWVRTDTLVSMQFDNGTLRSFAPTPLYAYMGQYSKYVLPGYRRVAVSSDDSNVLVSAYTGPKRVVLVATNTSHDPRPLRIRVPGAGKQAAVIQTTESAPLAPLAPLRLRAKAFQASLPAFSVTTFVVPRP